MLNSTPSMPSRSLSVPGLPAGSRDGGGGGGEANTAMSRRSHSFQLNTEPPNHTRRNTIQLSNMEPDSTQFWGYASLLVTYLLFISSMYAIVVSKYIPYTGNKYLDWIKEDTYYCLLLPITLFVSVYAVFWNWMGMKFFRHN
ncbi:hypothetical protein K493DRAFT_313366 [Basidiobolus meristosporus CBS 931.73]|uniref:Uncharacterized protein n=1 Tax=Basidiobolus meristosporus CBS 931.73 TaxID=1314790 RepID=A0A1Y1YM19_9FUNG|nr:hypothetical protein K493DRAFT_313366 [Basidiobolus meristosporus CBS 931.73]|eukprot:ORX99051.1 hypothetical protein K493DRAFT_313366 [Basidiobolus meristosporus CBS 931.73]